MAENTQRNRELVAQILINELRPLAHGHRAAIIDHIREQLVEQWNQCDDSWNHATDELMGQVYGEPFGERDEPQESVPLELEAWRRIRGDPP